MKKILHVIDHMGVGGAQRIVADLAGGGLGDGVVVLRTKTSDEITFPAAIQIYKGGDSLASILYSISKLDKIIQSQEFEIVHCHLPASFLAGLILSWKHKEVKFIFHEHGWVLLGRWLYSILLRLLPKQGLLMASSNLLEQSVQQAGYNWDLIVLHNFIDLERYYRAPGKRIKMRERWGFGEKDILIGFAGRLIGEKGWSELLRAFTVIETAEPVFLLIVGIGPDKEKVVKMIGQLGLEERVQLFGYESEMPLFYNGIDIFVNPTKREAFGLVQLEAQACGTPVIASNIEGVSETVNPQCAVLVPAGDSAALAGEIRKLIENPEIRDELSRRGLVNVQRFSKDLYFEKLKQVYRNL